MRLQAQECDREPCDRTRRRSVLGQADSGQHHPDAEERYKQQFPFPQLLAELGQREVKDIRLGELVDFIHRHLNGA